MPIYGRENARLSSPNRLEARFNRGGVLYDPAEIDRIEIWKFAEGEDNGGVLVDTVDGSNVVQQETGLYFVLYDAFVEGSPGTSPSPAPGAQGPGSPLQPDNDTAIVANVRYYDKWWYKADSASALTDSVGLTFFLYPDTSFVDAPNNKYRFEMKPDRKQVVVGEKLDMRLKVIPIPLFQEVRVPIVQYILPILTMKVRVVDHRFAEKIAQFTITFTGKEGIVPTESIGALPVGLYGMEVTLVLPTGQELKFRRFEFNVVD